MLRAIPALSDHRAAHDGAIGWMVFAVQTAAAAHLRTSSKGRWSATRDFIISNRRIGSGFGVGAVVSVRTWAMAVMMSSAMTFQWGLSGLFWFVAPNGLPLPGKRREREVAASRLRFLRQPLQIVPPWRATR